MISQVNGNLVFFQISTLTYHQVSAGDDHTCAVADEAAAFCWGSGQEGQLGNGATNTALSPVRVVR